MKSGERMTIAEIARRANVSAGTIDRVIHNRGEVAAPTREKILNLIREMNFKPHLLASTLASGKDYLVATLIPAADNDSLFWHQPSMGFEKASRQVGHYGITHQPFYFDYFDRNTFEKALRDILSTKPDAVILAPFFPDLTAGFLTKAEALGIMIIFINLTTFNHSCQTFVGQDPVHSGRVAAHLFDLALRKGDRLLIVNIMSEKGGNVHLMSREEGFRNYFNSNGPDKLELETINIYGNSQAQIEQTLKEGLANNDISRRPVSGIFVTNSRVFYVADFLERNARNNLVLAGYDLLECNVKHLMDNRIAFLISQNPVEQGYRSFMSVFEKLIMKKSLPLRQYLPIDIITRENIMYYLNTQSYD